MMDLAPIVLFAYNRPWHLEQTLQALTKNYLAAESELYIYCDGAKLGASYEEIGSIKIVREIANKVIGFKEVTVVERPENYGLAKNIISGVTEIIEMHGKVIVLEDDLITSRYFIKFLNEALFVHEKNEKIISIGANVFFKGKNTFPDTFLIPIPDCWGWATWRNRWNFFESNALKLKKELLDQRLDHAFNLEGAYDFLKMLELQINGKIDSWAIRWQAVAYLHKKLSLYPGENLTLNIGFGKGATHGESNLFSVPRDDLFLANRPIIVEEIELVVDTKIYNKMRSFYLNKNHNKLVKKVLKEFTPPFLLKFLKKIINIFFKNYENKSNRINWIGDYPTWDLAIKNSKGYGDPEILANVRQSVLKVKHGEAVYERDSVLFSEPNYPWPLISILLKISNKQRGRLHLIDFGGSLGSTYFQSRCFFENMNEWSWSVVEQKHFVDCGKTDIADDTLRFFYTIEDALRANQDANILLLSGVLQCLEDPYNSLEYFLDLDFSYVILDRTAFILGGLERLTIQKTSNHLYSVTYPSWFIDKDKLIALFKTKGYVVKLNFKSFAEEDSLLEDGTQVFWGGIFFEKITL